MKTRSKNKIWLLVGLILLATVSGCATSTVVVGQSLNSKNRDLSGIENNLVILKVNVESVVNGQYYRLSDIWATNTVTQDSYRFPMFSNMFMRTSNVPHEIEGNQLSQIVFLDLPAGTYTFDKLDLVTLEGYLDSYVDDYYVHRPAPKLTLDVSNGTPLYLGQLNIRVIGVEKIGSEFRANVRLVPRKPSPADIQQLKERYPALANENLRVGDVQQ